MDECHPDILSWIYADSLKVPKKKKNTDLIGPWKEATTTG